MRYVNGFLCAVLLLFAIAQYNDPDAVVWFAVYAVPAAWAGAAAYRPDLLAGRGAALGAYVACLAAALVATIYWWPTLPDGWIHIEEEREGLGMVVVSVAMITAGLSAWLRRRPPQRLA